MKAMLIVAALAAAPLGLKSLTVTLPDDEAAFTGPDADLLNGNCLACHGAETVLLQSRMTEAQWKASVAKMRDAYKAPIDDADAALLPAALVRAQAQ